MDTTITTSVMPAIPANSNPFHHDAYHMGTKIGTNCMIMMENHEHEKCKYLIVVNTETGERLRVSLIGEAAIKPSLVETIITPGVEMPTAEDCWDGDESDKALE